MKIAFFTLLGLIIVVAIIFGPRINKDIQKKRNYENTYAIQNIASGKDIRVYNARSDNGTKIILYNHNEWECLTWELIELEDSTYLLKNLYTQKSFQPSSSPTLGVTMWQQTLGGSCLQYWNFIKQPNGNYLIRLKETELYLTAVSDENNADIVLMPLQVSDNQLWKLIRQNPII